MLGSLTVASLVLHTYSGWNKSSGNPHGARGQPLEMRSEGRSGRFPNLTPPPPTSQNRPFSPRDDSHHSAFIRGKPVGVYGSHCFFDSAFRVEPLLTMPRHENSVLMR